MSNLALKTTRGRNEAPFCDTRDCSAHAKSRWLFDRTIAVSTKHAEPLHPHVRLQRQRLASNARWNPLSEAQASISRTAAPYSIYILPVALYFPPKSQGKSSLLLGLGIGAGGPREARERGGLDRVVLLARIGNNNGRWRTRA